MSAAALDFAPHTQDTHHDYDLWVHPVDPVDPFVVDAMQLMWQAQDRDVALLFVVRTEAAAATLQDHITQWNQRGIYNTPLRFGTGARYPLVDADPIWIPDYDGTSRVPEKLFLCHEAGSLVNLVDTALTVDQLTAGLITSVSPSLDSLLPVLNLHEHTIHAPDAEITLPACLATANPAEFALDGYGTTPRSRFHSVTVPECDTTYYTIPIPMLGIPAVPPYRILIFNDPVRYYDRLPDPRTAPEDPATVEQLTWEYVHHHPMRAYARHPNYQATNTPQTITELQTQL